MRKYFPYFLFIYHVLFAFIAWQLVLLEPADANNYWFIGQDLSQKTWFSFFQPGTNLIKIITFPLVKYLHLPFWSGFVLFSIFSYYGFYKLWKIMVSLTKNNNTAFLIGVVLILLPNLHLWTSFIGKEALLFVALVVMTEKILARQLRSKAFVFSFLVIALVRPHVAIILLVALLIALLWKGDLTRRTKTYVLGLASFGFIALYFILKKIAFIQNNHPWERILHIYRYHIKGLKKTEAYVPLDEYHLPYKLFTFYFRPLPFEKSGWFYQIWSFENFILLLLTCAMLYVMGSNFKRIKWDFYEIFTIFALVLLATMYVYAYANYGLLARTKIMSMPFLYVFIIKIFSYRRTVNPLPDAQSEV